MIQKVKVILIRVSHQREKALRSHQKKEIMNRCLALLSRQVNQKAVRENFGRCPDLPMEDDYFYWLEQGERV